MTGSAFLAILGVALGFSAGFAAGSIWTGAASHRRHMKTLREINRHLDGTIARLNPTITETDNDHRPR